jgi:hypothetical protein
MILKDLLKEWGLKVNDIKSRIDSNTLVVNGDVVTDLNMEFGDISEVISHGSFLQRFVNSGLFDKYKDSIKVFGLCNLMSGESNIDNELTRFLTDWKMIEVANQTAIFIRLGNPSEKGVLFDVEGQNPDFRSVIIVSEKSSVDIDKLKADLEKVNKQLNNPGFMKSAPKFKIDEAEAKRVRLETKLKELSV